MARERGARVISVVNAAGSSLARESDEVLLLNCGPEVGVAATKSFTAQVMVGNVIADAIIGRDTLGDPKRIGSLIEGVLRSEDAVREIAKRFSDRPDFYFIARGHHYPIAQEGALKLKELSYVHAEGMPASELKHGTLALIEKGTPVVVIAPSGEGFNSTISNALELSGEGGGDHRNLRQGAPRLQVQGRDPVIQRKRRSHTRGRSRSSCWPTSWRPRGRTTRTIRETWRSRSRSGEDLGSRRVAVRRQTKLISTRSDGWSCKTGKSTSPLPRRPSR